MTIRSAVLFLASIALAPSCLAACADSKDLQDFAGTIGGKYKIGMSLLITGNDVQGEYFYVSQLKDIRLRGVMDKATITLEELDAAGAVAGRFSGTLGKDCGQIDGTWQKAGAEQKLPFSLSSSGSSSGELNKRYWNAGAESDDVVHANAHKFWLGVKNGDKKAVASVLAYPLRAQIAGRKTQFRSAKQFIAAYDAIFTPAYKQAILDSVPHNMGSSWRGIMLGEKGEVWLNAEGKPFALNNP